MTITDPTLAAAIAAKGVPLSADHAPLSPEREAAIRRMPVAPPGLHGIGHHGSDNERRLYAQAADLHTANRELLAELDRVRGELAAAQTPRTPRLCLCGHSHLAHTVPAPHSCFAYGQTCPCPQYRQLLPDEALAQLERNRQAAAERARYDREAGR